MKRYALLVDLVLVVIIWQAAASLLRLPFLPGPFDVVITFLSDLPGSIGRHLVVSTRRVLVSLLIAVVLAMPVALMTMQSVFLDRILTPIAYLVYPVPKIVLLPILILFLGIGDGSKIALIVLTVAFQIFVVVRDSAARVRPETLDSIRSLGPSRWQLLRFFYFPMSVPALFTGLRIGIGTAIAMLFFAESFATDSGLGYYVMVETWGRMSYKHMYAGVLTMSLFGVGAYYLLSVLERRLCRWSAAIP